MRVAIVGPNLRDQSKGNFHVHAEGCRDLRNYGRFGRLGGEDPWVVEVENRVDLSDMVYPPEDFECESGENIEDFHFFPCVRDLP